MGYLRPLYVKNNKISLGGKGSNEHLYFSHPIYEGKKKFFSDISAKQILISFYILYGKISLIPIPRLETWYKSSLFKKNPQTLLL